MKLSELNSTLTALCNQVTKIATQLEANHADPALPADTQTTLEALQAKVQSLDDATTPATNPS